MGDSNVQTILFHSTEPNSVKKKLHQISIISQKLNTAFEILNISARATKKKKKKKKKKQKKKKKKKKKTAIEISMVILEIKIFLSNIYKHNDFFLLSANLLPCKSLQMQMRPMATKTNI